MIVDLNRAYVGIVYGWPWPDIQGHRAGLVNLISG